MPSSARLFMTDKTSPTSSGSSADVGSSKRIAFGSIASARAIPTRCCWPPDNRTGYSSALAASPTRSNIFRAFFLASAALRPATTIWPSMTFSKTVLCGHRLKRWNTMPKCSRSLLMFVLRSVTSTPSTLMDPESGSSKALMQRNIVDLPEPDGPRITTFSPR